MPVKLGKKKYEKFSDASAQSRKRRVYRKIEQMRMLHQ